MNLDDQLRAVLNEEAHMRTAPTPDMDELITGGQTRRRRRKAAWAGGAVLAAVVAAGGGYAVAQVGDDDSTTQVTHRPTPKALPDTGRAEAIAAGSYAIRADDDYVVVPYTLTVPPGWESQGDSIVGKHRDGPGAVSIEPYVLGNIRLADDTCSGGQTFGAPQTSAAGLVAGLRAQGSAPRVTATTDTTFGGFPATRIDLEYPAATPLLNCRVSELSGVDEGLLQVWTGYWVMSPAETASAYVVDVGGQEKVFLVRTAHDATVADRVELQSILDSIKFQAG